MIIQDTLFRIGNFNFKLNHLLVIGILIIAFSVSFLIRSQGAEYGYELNEFDPFFNFRATQYLLENGLSEYFNWHDSMSWHPNGRDVSATSQTMLHITAALTYQIFGGNSSLYDFTILFPVIFGSLTTIVIFALVRVIAEQLQVFLQHYFIQSLFLLYLEVHLDGSNQNLWGFSMDY
jgi:dolichyl-diphosphooligosaccharide--protein glycosyltransferase